MTRRTSASILQNVDTEVAYLIAESRNVSDMEGLGLFYNSKIHKMLEDDDLKMWYFSALAIYDMWEAEMLTGDPGNSLYLRGDEIA